MTRLVRLLAAVLTLTTPVMARPGDPPESASAARLACARAYLELVSDPTAEAVATFEERYGSAQRRAGATAAARLEQLRDLHQRAGRVEFRAVRREVATALYITAASPEAGMLEVRLEFNLDEPDRLDGADLTPEGAMPMPRALDGAARSAAVDRVAKVLESKYVFPETAEKMAAAVRGSLASGAYDRLEDELSLARVLTRDLQAVSRDKHLRVRLRPRPQLGGEDQAERSPAMDDNAGVRRVEVLPGGIGVVRLDRFAAGKDAEEVVAGAMAVVSHARAIVFDLRFNGGGSPDMVRFITSYLFEQRTHLNDMLDRDSKVVAEYWTNEEVQGTRPRADAPVYILTSGRTFSGAEEFTYNLKSLGRATVVGETTGGGLHPVRAERVGGGLEVFVPHMRARNAVTGTNWEGTGVEPDIACPADEALERALAEIRRGGGAG